MKKDAQIIILRDKPLKQKAIDIIKVTPYEPLMQMVVSEYKANRSLEQNKRHWAILEQVQYWQAKKGDIKTKEGWHDYFLHYFCQPVESYEVNGKWVDRYSSKDMSTKEFSEWDEMIEAHAVTDLDINLLGPDEWQEFKLAMR